MADTTHTTLMEISMFPVDKGASLSPYVARLLDIIDRSGLAYKTGPLGTAVEGPLPELLALVERLHAELARDCARIIATIKLDSRTGPAGRLESKLRSVEEKLGRAVRR